MTEAPVVRIDRTYPELQPNLRILQKRRKGRHNLGGGDLVDPNLDQGDAIVAIGVGSEGIHFGRQHVNKSSLKRRLRVFSQA